MIYDYCWLHEEELAILVEFPCRNPRERIKCKCQTFQYFRELSAVGVIVRYSREQPPASITSSHSGIQ